MKTIWILPALSVLIFIAVAPAAAQEVSQRTEAAAEKAEESPWPTVFRWANVVILFGGLGYLLRKPARDFFEGRRKDITSGLERAQQAQTRAHARMDEIEQRLASLTADIAALRSEAERESHTEREKILNEARGEIERIVNQSRQEMERLARSAERTIREDIADLIVDRAGKTLRTEMTEDDQKRVVVRFIKQL